MCGVMFDMVTVDMPVRPADVVAGHVNNARVLELLEHGRWAWFQSRDLVYVTGPILPVVTRIEVDYRREIFMGDVRVETRLAETENDVYRVSFEQAMYALPSPGKPLVTARVHTAFVNVADRKLRRFADFLAENKSTPG
jgi:acyl-CoA thioester hydrolase